MGDAISLRFEVVAALEIDPIFGTGAEIFTQFESDGHSDVLSPRADTSDRAVRDMQILAEPVLADAIGIDSILENQSGMLDGGQLLGRAHMLFLDLVIIDNLLRHLRCAPSTLWALPASQRKQMRHCWLIRILF